MWGVGLNKWDKKKRCKELVAWINVGPRSSERWDGNKGNNKKNEGRGRYLQIND